MDTILRRCGSVFQGFNKAKQKKRELTELEKAQAEYAASQDGNKTVKKNTSSENKKQHTKKNHYLLLYTFFVLGLMGTGYLLSPYGKVNEVYIEGNTIVPEQLILEASQITKKQTVIGTLTNQQTIEAQIQGALPQIKKAEVHLQGVHDILLNVEDFTTIAYIDNGNRYQSVLENGTILLDEYTVPLGNKPLLTRFELGPVLNQFISEFRKTNEEIQNSISEIGFAGTEENPYAITLHMNDGNRVKANLNDFADKIIYYPEILEELEDKKGIIDMEVGVYFTPFPNNQDVENTGNNQAEENSSEE